MTVTANIPLKGWQFYQSNLADSSNPFSVCTVTGENYNPGYLMRRSTSAEQRLNSHQLRLLDVSINTSSSKSGKILLEVKPNYEVEICFRIQDEFGVDVTTYHNYIKNYASNMKLLSNPSTSKNYSQFCSQTRDCQTHSDGSVKHSTTGSLSDYPCTVLRLKGGDRFECDVEAEHTDAYGSTANVFSLRLTPDDQETAVVAETDKSKYIGCNVVVTLHKVSKEVVSSEGERLIVDTLEAYQPEMYSDKFFIERNQLVTTAQQYIGDPFRWGGNIPQLAGGEGTDCSGFVLYVLNTASDAQLIDQTAANLSRVLPRVASPMPGDLAFFSGRNMHVDIYIGNGQLVGSIGQEGDGVGPSTGVLLRTISESLQPDFYCSVQPLIEFSDSFPYFGFTSIPEYWHDGAEHVKGNVEVIKKLQNYLYSIGMLKKEHVNGRNSVHMQKAVLGLQNFMLTVVPGSSMDDYIEGCFTDMLLGHINAYDFSKDCLNSLTTQSYIDLYNQDKTLHQESMMNPFESLQIQNWEYVENGMGLTLSANGGLYIKIANGWMLRLKLWAPVNFFPSRIKNHSLQNCISDCANLGTGSSSTSYLEILLKGGDELFVRGSASNMRPPVGRGNQYYNSGLFIRINGSNILVKPASNNTATGGDIRLDITDGRLPTGVWYGRSDPTNTNRNLADNNFVTELRRKLNLADQIGTLNSVDDTVEFEVNLAGSIEVGVQTQAGFKVTRLANGEYKLESAWMLGVGVELGTTKGSVGSKGNVDFAIEQGFEASAYISGTWESSYIFASKALVLNELPHALLSVGYFYSPVLAYLIDAAFVGGSASRKSTDKYILSLDTSLSGEIGINLEAFDFFSVGASASSSNGRRLWLEVDHDAGTSVLGLEFEISASVSAAATLSLPQSSSDTSDSDGDADEDEDDDEPSLGIDWNLAGTCKVEMSLLTIAQKPVESKPKELIKSSSVQASLSAIGTNVQQENPPPNQSLESVKFTGTILKDKTTLEIVIEFKASAWTVRALAVLISGSNPITLLAALTQLAVNGNTIQDISLQIYKVDETNSIGIEGGLKIAGVGLTLGASTKTTDRIPTYTETSTSTIDKPYTPPLEHTINKETPDEQTVATTTIDKIQYIATELKDKMGALMWG